MLAMWRTRQSPMGQTSHFGAFRVTIRLRFIARFYPAHNALKTATHLSLKALAAGSSKLIVMANCFGTT